ncbi:response regulator [Massilia sp. G4R7]|uniref:Response regulator n=1 Tax=Massilia phyllostachyos TaxID=2898585 RepID=A0ABS8Q198_9BURK|nr:response regulator [Massilia phyllostachyos]MCD2515349.1 response regulator [Massilia phyllostachyos]
MLKILLVDDANVDVMLTSIALESCAIPHQLSVAHDGAEAYEILLERRIDLLLLDIKMPRVNGFDLLEKLRSAGRPPISTIILSGSGLEADRLRAHHLGAIEYIQKAVDFSAFKHELRGAMQKHGFC